MEPVNTFSFQIVIIWSKVSDDCFSREINVLEIGCLEGNLFQTVN